MMLMKFKRLADYLDRLEKTSSRIEITKILAELFKEAKTDEIDKIVYLLLGRLAPAYENIVFNIAERMMLSVISQAYSKDLADVKVSYKKQGDLGKVAQSFSKKVDSDPSVNNVYDKLVKIAKEEGGGSVERKTAEMAALLKSLDSLSARFVARIPVGKLRLGFSDKTIIDALSWMEKGDKSVAGQLEKAYHLTPDVGALAKSVKVHGISTVAKGGVPVVGIPVLSMLAQRLKSPAEMVAKMGEVGVEPKFDGLRIQIHYKSGKDGFVKAYTRNLNENSWMFPELKRAGKNIHAKEVILDTEAVGLDEKRKTLANFQTTMTRRRKHEIGKTAASTPIQFTVFDILAKDGKSLMNLPYVERRNVLGKTIEKNKLLVVDEYIITKDPKEIARYSQEQIKKGLEGILVKKADSMYVSGRTGWRWVKMKEEEGKRTKLADTVDAVVMGYTRGRGKRASFGIGQFLAGIKDGEKIKTITKVGTGLTDDQFKELRKRLERLETKEKPNKYDVHKDLEPDFWVKPSLVVELAADEITKSPKHTAGFALRFPRLIKFRDDKSTTQATTMKEIKELFELQK